MDPAVCTSVSMSRTSNSYCRAVERAREISETEKSDQTNAVEQINIFQREFYQNRHRVILPVDKNATSTVKIFSCELQVRE